MQANIFTERPNPPSNLQSGGSGNGRNIFRVSGEDALEILGYGNAEKIESEIFGITRKLKRRSHSGLAKTEDN
jgi:hypothetical protein